MDIDQLPKHIWLLGKISGTIFKRTGQNIWAITIADNNKKHSKTFSVENYDSEKIAY